MKRALVVSLALSGSSLAACHQEAKSEERSLIAAIDRFRASEPAQQPQALKTIQDATCSDGPTGEICSAKAACLAYAEPTVAAMAKIAAVKQAVGAIEAPADAESTDIAVTKAKLDATLQEARTELDQGHKALDACDRQVQNLRMKYER